MKEVAVSFAVQRPKTSYVGVTGITDRNQAERILKLSRLSPHDRSRKVMIGVLANDRTLKGEQSTKRHPKASELGEIFTGHPQALNLAHICTRAKEYSATLMRTAEFCGPNLHGFQLNMCWPEPEEIAKFRSANPLFTIVLQIGEQAFQKTSFSESKILERLFDYSGLIDSAMIDRSGGKGRLLDLDKTERTLTKLYEFRKELGMSFGIAGGLNQHNLHKISKLMKKFPDLSFDAESGLRSNDDTLDVIAAGAFVYSGTLLMKGKL